MSQYRRDITKHFNLPLVGNFRKLISTSVGRRYIAHVSICVMILVYHSLLPVLALAPKQLREEVKCAMSYLFWSVVSELALENVDLKVYGDSMSKDEGAVILANHLSPIDYAVVTKLASQCGGKGKVNFFVWKRNMKIPDWKTAYNMYKNTQNWSVTSMQLTREFGSVVKSTTPYWTVVFPEVDSFTPTLHDKNYAACKETGAPIYNHLLAPRYSGFVQALSHLRKSGSIGWVYDLTLVYWLEEVDGSSGKKTKKFIQSPDHNQVIFRSPRGSSSSIGRQNRQNWTVEVYVRRIPVKSMPRKPHGLQKWLDKNWIRKSTFLQKKYKKSLKS